MGLFDKNSMLQWGPRSILLGGSDEDIPNRSYAPMDPNTNQLLNHQNELAAQSPDQLAEKYNSGLIEAKGLLGSGSDKSAALGMDSGAYSDAIRNRSEKNLNSYLNKVRAQNQYEGYQRLSDQTNRGYQPLARAYELNNQTNADQFDDAMNRYNRRQEIIGRLFGSVGALGGKTYSEYQGRQSRGPNNYNNNYGQSNNGGGNMYGGDSASSGQDNGFSFNSKNFGSFGGGG